VILFIIYVLLAHEIISPPFGQDKGSGVRVQGFKGTDYDYEHDYDYEGCGRESS
jgi:hypothetical protein